ncbi:uncharacterized protein LOC109704384 [Ananas comosus]|uniref:Uncharacterized protein LOC109704384 n=1 Tax=Ananas comosus TaxID=4615 RepID=A0A6P5EBK5_ANACO|nr:uncharacterized protein LOC109704384 [Ananas comosus]
MVESSRTKRREGETTGHARPSTGEAAAMALSISASTWPAPLRRGPSSAHHAQQRRSGPPRPRGHLSCTAPFVPEVSEALETLYSEFRAVDNMVAHNSARVLKAFKNARVGPHHFGGCTGYGHDDGGGRDALDCAFAEIVGAESAIVRSQVLSLLNFSLTTMSLY